MAAIRAFGGAAALAWLAACGLPRSGTMSDAQPGPTSTGQGGELFGGGGGGATTTGTGSMGDGGAGGGGGAPTCGGECVPPPKGGTLVRRQNLAPSCPGGWSEETAVYDGVDPGCSACSCAKPAGGSCTPGSVTRFDDKDCKNKKDGPHLVGDLACQDVDSESNLQVKGYKVMAAVAAGGSCTPSESAKKPLLAETLCGLSQAPTGACPGGSVCVPPGSADTGAVCVLFDGKVPCPKGYAAGAIWFGQGGDTRACQCQCGKPAGNCVDDDVVLWDSKSCSTSLVHIPADGKCFEASSYMDHDSWDYHAGVWSAPDCKPVDAHTGGVTFGEPKTLCCPK